MNKNVRRLVEYAGILVIVILMAGLFNNGKLHLMSNYPQGVTATFYCAGTVVNQHADPYLTEPSRACQNRYNPTRQFPWVEPAPLPGYALAAFGLMAHLPFAVFKQLWFFLLIASVLATAVILARLIKVPAILTMLCLAMVDGYFNLYLGEPPPFALLFIVSAAALGASKRYVLAALCASLAMFEPNIGLPVCAAMFLWWSGTRLTFLVTGAVFAAASVLAIGVPANIEYLHLELPMQALSEIAANDQYSLTRIMHLLGFSDKIALAAGSISYFCMFVIGVLIAGRVANAVGQPALVALLPPALVLLGGSYIHDVEMGAAIPAALILATSNRLNMWLRVGIPLAMVIPWYDVNIRNQIGLLEVGAMIAVVLIALANKPRTYQLMAIGLAVVGSVVLGYLLGKVPHVVVGPPTALMPLAIGPNDLTSANWAANVSRDGSYSIPHLTDVAQKVPTWLGLITIACVGISLAWTDLRAVLSMNYFDYKKYRDKQGEPLDAT